MTVGGRDSNRIHRLIKEEHQDGNVQGGKWGWIQGKGGGWWYKRKQIDDWLEENAVGFHTVPHHLFLSSQDFGLLIFQPVVNKEIIPWIFRGTIADVLMTQQKGKEECKEEFWKWRWVLSLGFVSIYLCGRGG